LLQHEIIIFHHPFFWYSTPAILKEWQDLEEIMLDQMENIDKAKDIGWDASSLIEEYGKLTQNEK
jgi:hypothetical protein